MFGRASAGFSMVAVFLVVAFPSVHAQTAKSPSQAVRPTAQPPVSIAGPNAEVVDLVKAGIKEATIVAFVKNYDGGFNTSARDIVALAKAGVSEAVIDAMMAKGKAGAASASAHSSSKLVDAVAFAPLEIVLQDGTPVRLQLTESISSDVAKLNDPVKLLVVDDVVVDGRALIEKGTLGSGKVSHATRQLLTRGGRLDVEAESVQAADGTEVKLRGNISVSGGRGLVRGNEATILSSTDLLATIVGTVRIAGSQEMKQDVPGTTRNASAPRQPVDSNAFATTVASKGGDSVPTRVKDGEPSVFRTRLSESDAKAKVRAYFNAKSVDYNVNPDTGRITSDWYGERRCGPGFHRCANKAAVQVSDEAGQTVVRVQVFERKREAGMNSKPWNESSTSKSRETGEFAVELHTVLAR